MYVTMNVRVSITYDNDHDYVEYVLLVYCIQSTATAQYLVQLLAWVTITMVTITMVTMILLQLMEGLGVH